MTHFIITSPFYHLKYSDEIEFRQEKLDGFGILQEVHCHHLLLQNSDNESWPKYNLCLFLLHSIFTTYFSSFLVGILSEKQKVAEFLKNLSQNSDKNNRPLCSLEWQWALFHTLQVFHMSLVLHKTFQRVSQAGN